MKILVITAKRKILEFNSLKEASPHIENLEKFSIIAGYRVYDNCLFVGGKKK